jgi:hypothetical protein
MAARGAALMAALLAAGVAVACTTESDGRAVDRVESAGEVPREGPIAVLGSQLLGLRTGRNDEPEQVVVSDDGGGTWDAADLPDRPEQLELNQLEATGDVAVVVGQDAEAASSVLPVTRPEFRVWATTDGDEWTGARLTTAGGVVGEPAVTDVGPLLVALSGATGAASLYTSSDRGSSWQRAELIGLDRSGGEALFPEEALAADGQLRVVVALGERGSDRRRVLTSHDDGATWSVADCGPDCPEPVEAGDLLHRFGETSTDGGATWHGIVVEPPELGDGVTLTAVEEVPGGWLASAVSYDAGDMSYGLLLRSDDGRRWHQLLPPDPCAAADLGRPNSAVGNPVRFEDRWYVTYDCSALISPEFGVVYQGHSEGREFDPIEATERDRVVFGDPVVAGERLLIPEFDDDGELVAITTIH